MRIFNIEIKASRWPWQEGYNWKGMKQTAILNPEGARFGAGWRYKLGFAFGTTTLMIDLLFGIIIIRKMSVAETKLRERSAAK